MWESSSSGESGELCGECGEPTTHTLKCSFCGEKRDICQACYQEDGGRCRRCNGTTHHGTDTSVSSTENESLDEDLPPEVPRTSSDWLALARDLNKIAVFEDEERKRTSITRALHAAFEAVSLLEDEPSLKLEYAEARVLHTNLLARHFRSCDQSESKRRLLQEAVRVDGVIGEVKCILRDLGCPDGNADRVLGVIEMTQRNYAEAKPHFLKALKLFLTSGQERSVECAMAFWNMYIVTKELGQEHQASLWLNAAIILYTAIEDQFNPPYSYTLLYTKQFWELTGQKPSRMLSEQECARIDLDQGGISGHQLRQLIDTMQNRRTHNIGSQSSTMI